MNDQELLKEGGQLLQDEEILEMDGIFFRAGEDIMKKSGEIDQILRNLNGPFQKLRKECLSARTSANDRKKALKEEKKEKEELADKADLLLKKHKELKADYEKQKSELDCANLEKEKMTEQLQELKTRLSEREREYQARETECRQRLEEYRQYYADARGDKEKAEDDLRKCQSDLEVEKKHADELQGLLEKEFAEKKTGVKEKEELEKQLRAREDEICSLGGKVRQYELQRQNMPFLTRLYDAYYGMMEKKEELPREFFDRLQNVMPAEDFDLFLSRALEPTFPVSYYLSLQAFLAVCGRYGEISGDAVKEALFLSDRLLSVILDFGETYYKEEGLTRLHIEAGDQFDRSLCKYVDESGGMYGKIGKVWLHGFRDGKKNKVYCSYVEGE